MRTVGVGVLSFILGALLALMLRPHAAPPIVPDCPLAAACPPCASCTPSTPSPRRPAQAPAKRPGPPAPTPLPDVQPDENSHRERLRSWFEASADRLIECVAKGSPTKRVLVEIKIEPSGVITDASLLGSDLAAESLACVRERIKALRAPREMLRGRETLVVSLNL